MRRWDCRRISKNLFGRFVWTSRFTPPAIDASNVYYVLHLMKPKIASLENLNVQVFQKQGVEKWNILRKTKEGTFDMCANSHTEEHAIVQESRRKPPSGKISRFDGADWYF